VFCGRCDGQLQSRAFNVKEVCPELQSRVVEAEICNRCLSVVHKLRRRYKWQLIQEQFVAK
jgi:hypothetical protein